jgi:hypothetical protein
MSILSRLHIVTTVTGNDYVALLRPFLATVREHHPDAVVMVFHKDLTVDRLRGLQLQFPHVEFREQGLQGAEAKHQIVGGKLRFFGDALNGIEESAPVLFIDCDTLLVRPVEWIFSESDFDVCFTWKEDGFPLNSGVMPARNTARLRTFLVDWNERTQAILASQAEEAKARESFGAADQMSLAQLVCRGEVMRAAKDSDPAQRASAYDGKYVMGEGQHALRLLGVNCHYLNETECGPIDGDTHVIHYKSGWHRILLHDAPFHAYRPEVSCREMHEFWQRHRRDASRHWAEALLAGVDDSAARDVEAVTREHCDRGMLNSELLLVYWAVKRLGIERIVESGRWLGHSTLTLSRLFEGTPVTIESVDFSKTAASIECERRLANRTNVRLHYGDAFKVLPEILSWHAGPTALLVDGPKGADAVRLIEDCFSRFEQVAAAFLHDSYLGSAARAAVEDRFPACAFTDDPMFVERFHSLDEAIDVGAIHPDQFHGDWRRSRQPAEGEDRAAAGPCSYGPTLAMMLPDKAAETLYGRHRLRNQAHRKARYAWGALEAMARNAKRVIQGG